MNKVGLFGELYARSVVESGRRTVGVYEGGFIWTIEESFAAAGLEAVTGRPICDTEGERGGGVGMVAGGELL